MRPELHNSQFSPIYTHIYIAFFGASCESIFFLAFFSPQRTTYTSQIGDVDKVVVQSSRGPIGYGEKRVYTCTVVSSILYRLVETSIIPIIHLRASETRVIRRLL